MARTLQILILIPLLTVTLTQQQQQQQGSQQDQSSVVFDVAQFLDNRGSFGIIVTPAPDASTLRPVAINNAPAQDQCNCVPYHACSDNVRSVDTNSDGRIEVSFNDRECGHFLDVCCGESFSAVSNSGNPTQPQPPNNQPQPSSPTQQPQTPQVPPSQGNQPSFPQYENRGCGIRNDGGLDFTVNDVDVSWTSSCCT